MIWENFNSPGSKTGGFVSWTSRNDPELLKWLGYEPTADQMEKLFRREMTWDKIAASPAGQATLSSSGLGRSATSCTEISQCKSHHMAYQTGQLAGRRISREKRTLSHVGSRISQLVTMPMLRLFTKWQRRASSRLNVADDDVRFETGFARCKFTRFDMCHMSIPVHSRWQSPARGHNAQMYRNVSRMCENVKINKGF